MKNEKPEKVIFREVQKFRQGWMWLIVVPSVAGAFVFFGLGINQQIVNQEPVGDTPLPDWALIIMAVFTLIVTAGLTWLFYTMRLIIEIRESGLMFRYPPLINKWKRFNKNEIDSFEVRTYKPIKEYGGWGVRVKVKKHGKAYNVKGNEGLQLMMKDGERILFGTQRKQAIHRAMQKMMKPGQNMQYI